VECLFILLHILVQFLPLPLTSCSPPDPVRLTRMGSKTESLDGEPQPSGITWDDEGRILAMQVGFVTMTTQTK
jgi:hypothetical protein